MLENEMRVTAAALSQMLGPLRRAVLHATRRAEGLPDLPDAHIEILRVVDRSLVITPGQIAAQLGLARPTVSNQLQGMRRSGLVTLARSDTDARVVHVTLSDFAAQLLTRYDNASRQILTAALTRMSSKEQAAITEALPALSHLQSLLFATKYEVAAEVQHVSN